jgi:PAS domain S-box-containing protein
LRSSVLAKGRLSEGTNAGEDAAPNLGGSLRALFRGVWNTGTGAVVKSRSLNWRLGMSTLAAVLPLALFALIMVGWIAHSEHEAERQMLVGDAYSLADVVGREINAHFLLSAALSHSSALQHGDLAGFAEQARDILAEAPGALLIVSSPDGHPVLTIPATPADSPVLRNRAALVARAIGSGSAFLSDVDADPALPEPHASIETPVFLDGKPVYEVAMILPLGQFSDLLRRQNLPPNWLSGIVDRNGAFVARLPSGPGRPGTLASRAFRDAIQRAPESSVTHYSVSGQKIVSAYAPVSGGWTVGVAANPEELGVGPSAFLLTSILAALAISGSLLLSYLNSRALARQVRELEAKTQNVLTGAPIATTPTGVREFDSLSDALARASELVALRTGQHRRAERELRNREEHFRLLADSLPQLVWTAGPDGRIEYMSARRERYGATGGAVWEGIIIHPDDRRATAEVWLRASETGLPYEMEHRLFVVGKGYAWHLSRASPLLDAQGAVVRWYGTTTDIDEQKQREENIRDLVAELNHRSRNLLAVAQAIARCSVANATTIQEFQVRYSERLLGLATSQDLLTDRNWRGVPFEALVRAQAAPMPSSRNKRFLSEGPMVLLSPNATQTLGLALHELCDNAVKHGALSDDEGRVSLVWRIDESGTEPNFEMTWRESGGPPVKASRVSGFGAVVLERLAAAGLNAASTLSFEAQGVVWRLVAPLKEVVKTGSSDHRSPADQVASV